jgi:hypothetical protein
MNLPFKNQKVTSALFFIIISLMSSPLILFTQSASGLTGVVPDAGGLLLPGVEVRLKDTKTSRANTTTTNEQGVYTFNNVQPGAGYSITFSKSGFQNYTINGVS